MMKWTGCYDCECLCLDCLPPTRLQRAIFKHHSHFYECAVQATPRHATPRHATPRHKFSYKNLSSETRPIPQYTVCFTYIIRHEPCSNSLRRFNYLSGISIFTSQLVWDTRLPLVECGRACHAPAIILVHPIHSPTTTVVIHPVSIPSNPSALFCKPDEWLWSMADIAE